MDMLEKAAKAAQGKIQFNDFGHANEDGDWIINAEQMAALERVSNEVARAVIAAMAMKSEDGKTLDAAKKDCGYCFDDALSRVESAAQEYGLPVAFGAFAAQIVDAFELGYKMGAVDAILDDGKSSTDATHH
jgi:hypothetical protein